MHILVANLYPLLQLELISQVHIPVLAKLLVQFPLLMRECLNGSFHLLLPVDQVQVELLQLAEYLIHLVWISEVNLLFRKMGRQVDQILPHQQVKLRLPVLVGHVLAAELTSHTRQMIFLRFFVAKVRRLHLALLMLLIVNMLVR